MKNQGSREVAEALRYTPGVFWMHGGDSTDNSYIYIRGFGDNEAGYYFDGIPINHIYDGNSAGGTDLTPFTTFGISQIQVSKGYTSPAFSAGKMGGAINFVSSVPVHNLEATLGYRFISNNEHRYNAQVGRNLGDNYFQLTFAHINRQSLNYSYDFGGSGPEPIPNSAYKSYMFSGKYGFFIGDNHEYSLNFYHIHAKRCDNLESRFCAPYDDKTALYALGDSRFSELFSLSSKIWYAMNTNTSGKWSRSPWTYGDTTSTDPWSSIYYDYSLGITETFKFDFSEDQNLKAGFILKNETHDAKDWNADFSKRDWSVLNHSYFAEYALRANDMFRFVLSGSYDRHDGLNVKNRTSATEVEKKDNKHLWGWALQGILYFQPVEPLLLHANVGRKTNLPKIRALYGNDTSGNYVPNNSLTTENLINYELGVDFNAEFLTLGTSSFGAAAYYNDIRSAIYLNRVDSSLCATPSGSGASAYCLRHENAKQGYSMGGEIYAKQGFFSDRLTLGANWAYVQRRVWTYSNSGVRETKEEFTEHPRQNINMFVQIAPSTEYNINFNGSVQTSRYTHVTNTEGYDEYIKLPTVVLFDLSTNYNLTKRLTLSVGAYNLFDKNYNYESSSYTSAEAGGYAGRRVYAGFEYNYSK